MKRRTPATAVTAGISGGGALGVLVSWALASAGVELPPGVESAIGTILGAVVGYFSPGGRKGDPR